METMGKIRTRTKHDFERDPYLAMTDEEYQKMSDEELAEMYDYYGIEFQNRHMLGHGRHVQAVKHQAFPVVPAKPLYQPSEAALKKVRSAFLIEELQAACTGTEAQWFDWYKQNSPETHHVTSGGEYVFRQRKGSKILAMAHLDSVQAGRTVEDKRAENGRIYCPVLDDRLGLYVIRYMLPRLGIQCDLLLLDDEESGNSTARYFSRPATANYNWMVEFDRKGEDVVTYDFHSAVWKDALKTKFDIGHGTFSDIKALTFMGCSGVNVGVGYADYHGAKAYFDFDVFIRQMARFYEFYTEHKDTLFVHEKPKYSPPPKTVYATNAYSTPSYTPGVPIGPKLLKQLGGLSEFKHLIDKIPPPGSTLDIIPALLDTQTTTAEFTEPVNIEGHLIFRKRAKGWRLLHSPNTKHMSVWMQNQDKNAVECLNKLVDDLAKLEDGALLTEPLMRSLWQLVPTGTGSLAPGMLYDTGGYKSKLKLVSVYPDEAEFTLASDDGAYACGVVVGEDTNGTMFWVEAVEVNQSIMTSLEKLQKEHDEKERVKKIAQSTESETEIPVQEL